MAKGNYRKFEDAREYVRTLSLKSDKEWRATKTSNKPKDIPVAPNTVYKNEWISLGDWLGTEKIAPQKIKQNFLSFRDARKLIREAKLQIFKEKLNN